MTGIRPRVDLPRSLVLVGLMGAGKSAIGRRLAHRLGLPFVDADQEIERAAGCTVEDIFELYGEPAFRDVERRVIARLLTGPLHVLATGGGAFMDIDTRASIAENGITLWLRADLEVLLARTSRRNNRPLLKRDDPAAVLQKLIDIRYPVYARADIVIDSRDAPLDHTVDIALDAIDLYLAESSAAAAG